MSQLSMFKQLKEQRRIFAEQEKEMHGAVIETRDLIKNLIDYHKERDKLILDTLRGLIQ